MPGGGTSTTSLGSSDQGASNPTVGIGTYSLRAGARSAVPRRRTAPIVCALARGLRCRDEERHLSVVVFACFKCSVHVGNRGLRRDPRRPFVDPRNQQMALSTHYLGQVDVCIRAHAIVGPRASLPAATAAEIIAAAWSRAVRDLADVDAVARVPPVVDERQLRLVDPSSSPHLTPHPDSG